MFLVTSLFAFVGLFDSSDESEATGKEIVRCVNLAKDGIHAILMVFSARSRFSPEEEAAIESLKTFFGEKILDYMIAVFTGGDDLESSGQTLKEFIGCTKHQSLQVSFLLLPIQLILKFFHMVMHVFEKNNCHR